MKTIARRISLIIAIILAVGSFAGCETGAAKQGHSMAANDGNVFTCDVVEGLTLDQVKSAVMLSLAEREWSILEATDTTVSAELDATAKRGIHGYITVSFTDALITITDNSVDAKGNHFVAIRWDKYLVQSLNKFMLVEVNNGDGASK